MILTQYCIDVHMSVLLHLFKSLASLKSRVIQVLDNHKSVLTSFGIQTTDEELDLPYIYLISKMHKNPYKHRFIAGSSSVRQSLYPFY